MNGQATAASEGRAAATAAVLLLVACGACRALPPKAEPDADRFAHPAMFLSSYEVPTTIEGERSEVAIDVPAHLPEVLREAAKADPRERLGLVLYGIEAPRSGGYYDVYAGLPTGAEPDPEGPYHLGTLAIFGPEGAKAEVSYDLGSVVETLAATGRWRAKLTLTFVRRGLEPPEGGKGGGTTGTAPAGPVHIEMIRIVRG